MTFAELAGGCSLFIDANVFVYHFVGSSPQCTQLLARCQARELRGCTSVLVLAETMHRLMMIEAVQRKLVSPGNVARKLAERPEVVRQLATHQASVDAIPAMGIDVFPLQAAAIASSARFRARFGLLTNDSLLAGAVVEHAIPFVASADRRLAAVPDFTVAVPTDL